LYAIIFTGSFNWILPDFPRLADLLVPLLRTIHSHSHSLQRFADAYSSFEKASRFVPPPFNPIRFIGFLI
jgi:hypothetical protein